MKTRTEPVRAVLVLAATLLAGSGCVSLHGPEEWRRDLSAESGVVLDPEVSLSVNRAGVWLARVGLKMSGEQEISLKGVHHVDVGVYRVVGLRKGFEAPRAIHPDQFRGWSPLARVREEGEQVLVLTRERSEKIRQMLVVVAEADEWVIVRVKGKLDRILEEAMAMAFDEVDRADLYRKTREERGLETEETPEPERGDGETIS